MSKTDDLLWSVGKLKTRMRRPRVSRPAVCTTKQAIRFTKWNPVLKYTRTVAPRVVFASAADIERAFCDKTLSCDCLAVYTHRDHSVGRTNRMEPKYAAVFELTSGTLIQPQQKHYRQCYRNSGRVKRALAYTMCQDGSPYWCCIYADRLKNERLSKLRYTKKMQRVALGAK